MAAPGALLYNAASDSTAEMIMLETGAILAQVKDLKERTDVLRGYL